MKMAEPVRGFPDFSQRWTGQEEMDSPTCDEARLLRTVDQFASINFWVSRYRYILRRWILAGLASGETAHLIDFGAGGCEIAVWLLHEARQRGIQLQVTALDPDARILAHAHKRFGHEKGLTLIEGGLESFVDMEADFVFCNHVLHHLPDDEVPELFAAMDIVATRRWIVSDLRRSRAAYAGFQLFGRFYRDSFAFEDGKRSILRGFTPGELRQHLGFVALGGRARVHALLPGRLVVVGEA